MNIRRLYDFLLSEKASLFYNEIADRNISQINQIEFLKNKYPELPISELLTLERLRKNASKRIDNAKYYLFTTKGVEQSSSSEIAKYHASLLKNTKRIADLCCGNGIDLLNIAVNKEIVYAVDNSNNALLCSQFNCKIQKLSNIKFINDTAENFAEKVEGIFIDPDRRPNERRVINGDDISPNMNQILKIIENHKNVIVKLSPVFDYPDLILGIPHTWHFVSEKGLLKEILLCTGIYSSHNIKKIAVLLPDNIFKQNYYPAEVSKVGKYIYDPDPAIIRSGLVQDLAYTTQTNLINKQIAILTSNQEVSSPFLKKYQVIDNFHYNKKNLQKYVTQNDIGRLVIKVKGFPERPHQILSKLKIKGKSEGLVYLIRMDQEFICLVLKV